MTSKLNDIHKVLLSDAPHLKNKAFHYSEGNEFSSADKFLFDTPHGYWGEPYDRATSDNLPEGHSQRFVNAYSSILDDAKHTIDVVNMGEITREFREGLFRGIKESLYKTGNPITVRIFIGLALNDALFSRKQIDTAQFLRDMKQWIGFADTLSVYVGVATLLEGSSLLPWKPITGGWNHAKFVAVDSQYLLVGGHNWAGGPSPYLGSQPVYDLSIRVNGAAAHGGMAFANYLWDNVRQNNSHAPHSRIWCHSMIKGVIDTQVPPPVVYQDVERRFGTAAVLAVGQPGISARDSKGRSPSLLAAYTAIGNAERVINLSQQNLGCGGGGFGWSWFKEFRSATTCGNVAIRSVGRLNVASKPEPKGEFWYDATLFTHLAHALRKNVKLNVVISNRGAGDYTTRETPGHIYRALGHFLREIRCPLDEARRLIKAHVQIKTIMSHGHIPWSKGSTMDKANHAKFWSVDDELFYVGSHNLYPSVYLRGFNAHHDEWGVVVGGQPETKTILDGYFTPLFASGYPVECKEHFLDGL
jgi:phosphatidylserine/phosphatidylglycerophosphate/cardiolipin synthase-like enzyme